MKKKEKRMILILLVILIIAIVIFVVSKNTNKKINTNENTSTTQLENTEPEEFVQVQEDGTKLNTSTELNKEKQVGNYKFENMQLTTQDNQTVLLADVTNTGSSKTDIQLVDVTLLDKDGNEIITVGGIISQLEPGEKTQFNTSMTLDYANTYDFKITLK
jgi:Na+-translocating ferredoxin:NAD+ oxidoreductase RnfG subunit